MPDYNSFEFGSIRIFGGGGVVEIETQQNNEKTILGKTLQINIKPNGSRAIVQNTHKKSTSTHKLTIAKTFIGFSIFVSRVKHSIFEFIVTARQCRARPLSKRYEKHHKLRLREKKTATAFEVTKTGSGGGGDAVPLCRLKIIIESGRDICHISRFICCMPKKVTHTHIHTKPMLCVLLSFLNAKTAHS